MPLSEDERRRYYDEGVGKYGKERVDKFLSEDPGDFHRIDAALSNSTGHRPYDSQSSDPGELEANRRADEDLARRQSGNTNTGGNSNGGNNSGQAYQAYLQPQQDPMLARLVSQMEADRARQEQERAQMREIVMSQLGQATAPVDANSPGLKPIIDAQNLSLQRGADRQRSAAAERAVSRGYTGDSGPLRTRINQIEQGRGESEANMTAQILYNELGAKRQQVAQLLDLAVRSGDAASARTLQGQLATLSEQMNQQRFQADLGFREHALDVQNDQFGRDLGFRERAFDTGESSQRYRFDNDLAYRLAQLQLMGNQNAMGFLGGIL